MNQLKAGTFLIVLGNLLYLVFTFFSGNETSNFGKFSSGLLVAYMSKNNKDKVEKN